MSQLSSDAMFDVAVVGGGPAGAATAIALRRASLKVALIEGSSYQDVRAGEHLIAAAKPLLEQLGIGSDLWQQSLCAACPLVQSAWGDAKLQGRDAIFNAYGEDMLLTRPDFDRYLAAAARSQGVALWQTTRPQSMAEADGGFDLALNHKGTTISLRSRLLVDATGRRAAVGRRLGARSLAWDRLIGIIGYGQARRAAEPARHEVLVEAAPDGWWYSSRLRDGRLVTTYMTDADRLTGPPGAYLLQRLRQTEHTRQRVAVFGPLGEFHVRPASSRRLDRIAGQGWLAVGDAAMSWDPLSSSGIYNGIDAGINAADAIRRHLAGDRKALPRYAQQVEESFADYLRTRVKYYRLEKRWPDAAFWQLRHAG